ncbi:MAG TPA: hypothetical protein PLF22_12580, partial [Pseudomonadales bacterium]|nr:hypothetical protein [Pseudomonadales bacterium]
ALQSKYSLPSIWLSALFAIYLFYNRRLILLPLVMLAAWPLVMSTELRSSLLHGYLPTAEKIAYKTATQDVVNFLNAHPQRPALAYCGWASVPRSVMYLLPGSEVMPDCYKAIGDNLSISSNGVLAWKGTVQYWLIKDKQISGLFPKESARFDVMQRTCNPQPLFDNSYYQILDCPWDRLKSLEQQPDLLREMHEFVDPLV